MTGTFQGPPLAILMYHAVLRDPLAVWDWCFLDEGMFTEQMEYLKRHFEVVPLRIVDEPRAVRRRPQVALTFDDGFRNNADIVFPVLARLGLPATFFLATDFVGTNRLPWFCEVNRAVSASTLEALDWGDQRFDLSSNSARVASSARLQALLKTRPQPRLLEDLKMLVKQLVPLGLSEPDEADMKRYGVLSSEQVKALANSPWIEFGAHSMSHAILSLLEPDAVREEIGQSIHITAQLTGKPCRTFAYPNVRACDYTEESVGLLNALGVRISVTTAHGVNEPGQPLLELKRLGVGADTSLEDFAAMLSPVRVAIEEDAKHKILFIYRVCGLGGVETSIVNKTKALRQAGCQVEALFLGYWGQGGLAMAQRPGFHVETSTQRQLAVMQMFAPDVVVIVDTPEILETVVDGAPSATIYFETHASYQPALERYYSKAGDSAISGVLAPSAFNKRLLTERGLEDGKICVIPNAVDSEMFHPQPEAGGETWGSSEAPLVLSVGRLEPQKNTLEFIKIANMLLLEGRGLRFVVVGDAVDTGDYADDVQGAVSAGHREQFSFIPRIPYEQMPELYTRVAQSGGCLVLTSLNESQPMIILEAMACGCPVVAVDVGGISEIVIDSITGYLYQSGDIRAAVSAVRQVLDDRVVRMRVADEGVRLIARRHSLQQAADLYLALFKLPLTR